MKGKNQRKASLQHPHRMDYANNKSKLQKNLPKTLTIRRYYDAAITHRLQSITNITVLIDYFRISDASQIIFCCSIKIGFRWSTDCYYCLTVNLNNLKRT